MILFIDGSDIAKLELGHVVIDNDNLRWRIEPRKVFAVRPEQYLATIDEYIGQEEIESIWAVTGPGSATALRTSLTIVNSLSLAKNIPVYGLQLGEDWTVVAPHQMPSSMLLPTYHHDPVITVSTRDSLLRTL